MKTILSDEQQDACTPTQKQVTDFINTPDDKTAALLRNKYSESTFKMIVASVLYGINIAKSQDSFTRLELAKQVREIGNPYDKFLYRTQYEIYNKALQSVLKLIEEKG